MLTHRLFADLVEVCWLPSAGERDRDQRNSGGGQAGLFTALPKCVLNRGFPGWRAVCE